MMMRKLAAIYTLLFMIAMGGTATAEERPGFEAGIKLWFNDWTHDVPGFGSITSDVATLIGPAIHGEFGNRAFAEASYLASGSDYRFSNTAVAGNTERQDVDLAVGYRIVPEFSLLAGYKNSRLKDLVTQSKATLYGPFIGARADLPMDRYLAFYFASNFLFTKFKQQASTGDFQENSPGWTFEFGLRQSFSREFTGMIGYKFETNTGQDSNVLDSFSGLTLGGMFSF